MNILSDLLEYENTGTVLKYRFTYKNIYMWPFIRYLIFSEYAEKEMRGKSVTTINRNVEHDSKKRKLLKSIACVIKAMLLNIKSLKKQEILFIYGNSGNELRNKKYNNRFFDYYAELMPEKTKMLELNYTQKLHKNRAVKNVYYGDLIDKKIELFTKISKAQDTDISTICEFVTELKLWFGDGFTEEFYSRIRSTLETFSKKICYIDKYYRRFLEKIASKIVIMEDASYGFDKACKLWVMNDMGIVTAEMQHGMVATSHSAYNYADSIINSEYRKYLPKYFLTYGERWNQMVHTSSEAIVVGAPELAERLSAYDFNKCEKKGCILIVLGMDGTYMLRLLRDLFPYLSKNQDVIVKSHPNKLEWGEPLDEFKEFEKYSNFHPVPVGNIYDFIAEAEYVIGEYSTVLFEADACGKKVCIFECEHSNAYIPKSLGNWFSNAEEFLEIMSRDKQMESSRGTYYDFNWKENYIHFIESAL